MREIAIPESADDDFADLDGSAQMRARAARLAGGRPDGS
jgi:hypothetical protein